VSGKNQSARRLALSIAKEPALSVAKEPALSIAKGHRPTCSCTSSQVGDSFPVTAVRGAKRPMIRW
jgi:hypothetical protein